MSKGIYLSKPIFFLALIISFGIILLIGLLAGLLTHQPKCKDSTISLPSTTSTRPATRSTTEQPYDPNGIRLPKNIIPINYNLNIKAYFEPVQLSVQNDQDKFEGTVVVDFILTKSTDSIKLHCDSNIRILDTIQIKSLSTNKISNIEINQTEYQDNQLFEIFLKQQLQIGNYTLKLDYTSNYGPSSNIVGFYKTSYTEDGVVK
jgi:hypothetical protein